MRIRPLIGMVAIIVVQTGQSPLADEALSKQSWSIREGEGQQEAWITPDNVPGASLGLVACKAKSGDFRTEFFIDAVDSSTNKLLQFLTTKRVPQLDLLLTLNDNLQLHNVAYVNDFMGLYSYEMTLSSRDAKALRSISISSIGREGTFTFRFDGFVDALANVAVPCR